MARSLNKVTLIGNLTRDPELRYTPQGTAVCDFGLATNRQWTTDAGEKREETEFHRIVAWNKLAELCAQLLSKGRKVYVEGRLQTRRWTTPDGQEKIATEIVISDMIILDSRPGKAEDEFDIPVPEEQVGEATPEAVAPTTVESTTQGSSSVSEDSKSAKTQKKSKGITDDKKKIEEGQEENSSDEDIPF